MSRFVSPVVNHRTDEYGGSTENRARLVMEIIKGIRKQVPSLHIIAKINSSGFTHGGLDEGEIFLVNRSLSMKSWQSISVNGLSSSIGAKILF